MTDDELIATLREYAEWADGEIWNVPIMLPDVLSEAANRLEKRRIPENDMVQDGGDGTTERGVQNLIVKKTGNWYKVDNLWRTVTKI